MKTILDLISQSRKKRKKLFAILIDPDKFQPTVIDEAVNCKADLFFVGGSEVKPEDFSNTVSYIKKRSKIPLVIFPGDENQLSKKADALLYLSLISGRNSEYLIGKHVSSAMKIRKSKVEVIPTGYIIVNGGSIPAAARVSGTQAMHLKNKGEIIATAVAGELLGMKMIYLEAGSGAKNEVPSQLIKSVKQNLTVPLIVGGGIDTAAKAAAAWKSGADIIVVGNAIEKNISLVKAISSLKTRK